MAKQPLRVLFFGSDAFSVECLQALFENKERAESPVKLLDHLEVVCLRSVTLGKKVSPPVPARVFAEINGLHVHDAPPVEDKSWASWCEVCERSI